MGLLRTECLHLLKLVSECPSAVAVIYDRLLWVHFRHTDELRWMVSAQSICFMGRYTILSRLHSQRSVHLQQLVQQRSCKLLGNSTKLLRLPCWCAIKVTLSAVSSCSLAFVRSFTNPRSSMANNRCLQCKCCLPRARSR